MKSTEKGEEESSDGSDYSDAGDYSDSDEDGDEAVEVVVPRGMRAGQTIDVRVPSSAGGGVVAARIPPGAVEGDVFEVYLGDMLIS